MSTPWPCRRPAGRARPSPCWTQAIARNPTDPDLLFTLAATLLQQGDLAGARRHAQALVRIAPAYPNAQELLRAVSPGGG